MAVQWTREQQQVISLRDRNILVSAAAGSGKTAVLVERILSMILQKENPIDVDKLLVVTFTRAAAGEMKERIQAAIEQKLAEDPDNEHLQRQSALIAHAQINTIDGFCSYVVRSYFHTISLDPAFRMMDEGEGKLMKADVVQKLLEEAYEQEEQEFLQFVECYASGKSDEKLEDLILKLYEFSMSYPFPKEWLAECRSIYENTDAGSVQESVWMRKMWEYSERTLRAAREIIQEAIRTASSDEGPYMYLPMLEDDLRILDELLAQKDYDSACLLYRQVKFQRISSKKDKAVSDRKREQVKTMRDTAKGLVKDLTEQYYQYSMEELGEQLEACRAPVRQLTLLTERFIDAYSAKKREKNLLDFADLEHFALEILVKKQEDGTIVRTEAAEELAAGFAEIMIDEYQDSNYVQEMLLTSVSGISDGRYNIFMVGDVKQSIYRFRLARPELFLEKYHSYSTDDSRTQRIDLHKNFRSRAMVLSGANYIFRQIMTPELGNISYDDAAALYPGADYPEEVKDTPTELLLLEKDTPALEDMKEQESLQEIEAHAVAGRIRELVGREQVLDKKTGEYRPAAYRDCVVLLRAAAGWADSFVRVLNAQGIPAYSTSRTGYFSALEVQTVLNYLQICDNPRQDIPLAAVLHSPICGCTAEEMALVRSQFSDGNLYAACRRYALEGHDEKTAGKISEFLRLLERMRSLVSHTPIHELLMLILKETGYANFAAAMPGGEQRQANLDMLVEKAIEFEATSYRGLFNFIRYIEKLRKYEVDFGEVSVTGEQADTVRIMSIHKSKGLEFPIVFVSGMGKGFNMQDSRAPLILHSQMGIGSDAVDPELRTRRPVLLKQVMKRELALESLSEELRILYVALTRAKERLILTGTVGDLGKTVSSCAVIAQRKETGLSCKTLEHAKNCWEWILAALARHPSFQQLYDAFGVDVRCEEVLTEENADFIIRRITAEELVQEEVILRWEQSEIRRELEKWDTGHVYDETVRRELSKKYSYQYPYAVLSEIPAVMSVSELKREQAPEPDAEPTAVLYPEEEEIIPRFIRGNTEEKLQGARRGTVYHKIFERLDYGETLTADSADRQIMRMRENGYLLPEEYNSVYRKDFQKFLESPLGHRMARAYRLGTLRREQPFAVSVPAARQNPAWQGEEEILVQGIIDAWFEENDGLVLVDYKTDHVKEAAELAERYRIQLQYYAEALKRTTGIEVKEKIIYSVALGEEIIL